MQTGVTFTQTVLNKFTFRHFHRKHRWQYTKTDNKTTTKPTRCKRQATTVTRRFYYHKSLDIIALTSVFFLAQLDSKRI